MYIYIYMYIYTYIYFFVNLPDMPLVSKYFTTSHMLKSIS